VLNVGPPHGHDGDRIGAGGRTSWWPKPPWWAADDTTGEAICAFVVLKRSRPTGDEAAALAELRDWVGKEIGPIAKPKDIRFGDNLPKTRSGKIMRRLLRSLAKGEAITQDTSTLENPAILEQLSERKFLRARCASPAGIPIAPGRGFLLNNGMTVSSRPARALRRRPSQSCLRAPMRAIGLQRRADRGADDDRLHRVVRRRSRTRARGHSLPVSASPYGAQGDPRVPRADDRPDAARRSLLRRAYDQHAAHADDVGTGTGR
jgi:hypothetical protein